MVQVLGSSKERKRMKYLIISLVAGPLCFVLVLLHKKALLGPIVTTLGILCVAFVVLGVAWGWLD